jgi:DNA-binding NarL/FixJ family response regulator
VGLLVVKQGPKIALVEQNRYHARLMAGELLEKYPSSLISILSCGQTALNEMRRNAFDIAIIGLDLPDVDGWGFVQLIRKEAPHLPIVAVGDTPSEQTAAEVAEAGADKYLAKEGFFHVALSDIVGKLYSRLSADTKRRHSCEKLKQKEQAALIRVTAGTLYHEVNNPLMTILGMTELILNNGYECDREVAKKLRIIRRSAQRIQSALTRLSTISRPAIKKTPWGKLIDPKKSRATAKSGI